MRLSKYLFWMGVLIFLLSFIPVLVHGIYPGHLMAGVHQVSAGQLRWFAAGEFLAGVAAGLIGAAATVRGHWRDKRDRAK